MSYRRPLGVVLLLALPFAAGCGAGTNNATDKERATPYVGTADAGSIAVRGVRVLPATSGDVAGYLLAAIVNRGSESDTLTNATVAGGAITPRDITTLTIDPNDSLVFNPPDSSGTSGPALEITALATPLTVGNSVPVTFTFEHAGTVRVDVPIKSEPQIGTTATSQPIATTGSYPTPSETAATEP